MSYDVTVMGEGFNITSNLHQFFTDFGVYPGDWEGMHRAVVAERIEEGLGLIRASDPTALSRKYDAPNGWGKVEHAVPWLEEVLAACKRPMPSEIVSVWR